ncbi:MAG: hypothetical protein AB8I58_19470, partial [Anaerolineales bacterium]
SLVCTGEILAERLLQRPEWRGTRDPAFIEEHQRFNHWFIHYNRDAQQPPITIIDTSGKSIEETTQEVKAWIDENQE